MGLLIYLLRVRATQLPIVDSLSAREKRREGEFSLRNLALPLGQGRSTFQRNQGGKGPPTEACLH
jgi:hypothetical protein